MQGEFFELLTYLYVSSLLVNGTLSQMTWALLAHFARRNQNLNCRPLTGQVRVRVRPSIVRGLLLMLTPRTHAVHAVPPDEKYSCSRKHGVLTIVSPGSGGGTIRCTFV